MNEKERNFYRDLLEDTRNIYKDWVDGLQAKVRQLKKDKLRLARKLCQVETNTNEAIKYLKYALDEEKETPSKHNDWRLDLLEILERGKNNV